MPASRVEKNASTPGIVAFKAALKLGLGARCERLCWSRAERTRPAVRQHEEAIDIGLSLSGIPVRMSAGPHSPDTCAELDVKIGVENGGFPGGVAWTSFRQTEKTGAV